MTIHLDQAEIARRFPSAAHDSTQAREVVRQVAREQVVDLLEAIMRAPEIDVATERLVEVLLFAFEEGVI